MTLTARNHENLLPDDPGSRGSGERAAALRGRQPIPLPLPTAAVELAMLREVLQQSAAAGLLMLLLLLLAVELSADTTEDAVQVVGAPRCDPRARDGAVPSAIDVV